MVTLFRCTAEFLIGGIIRIAKIQSSVSRIRHLSACVILNTSAKRCIKSSRRLREMMRWVIAPLKSVDGYALAAVSCGR